mmetsp:Transcript_8493/g.20883  ORF Transcript_8493/g.20883 Transcript_8493/m.20883 type:complete len:202 (-) Transcript_8493:82-687(-)
MHQNHVDIILTKLLERSFDGFPGLFVAKFGRVHLGCQKDFLPGNSLCHCLSHALPDRFVVHVEVGPIDVASSHEQIPLDRSLDANGIIRRRTAAHSNPGKWHGITASFKGSKELALGSRLGSQIFRNRWRHLGTQHSVAHENGRKVALDQWHDKNEETGFKRVIWFEVAPSDKDCDEQDECRHEAAKQKLENKSDHTCVGS